MMKYILPIATAFIIYLAGCFANAGFDISLWSEAARGFIAFSMIGGVAITAILAYIDPAKVC